MVVDFNTCFFVNFSLILKHFCIFSKEDMKILNTLKHQEIKIKFKLVSPYDEVPLLGHYMVARDGPRCMKTQTYGLQPRDV